MEAELVMHSGVFMRVSTQGLRPGRRDGRLRQLRQLGRQYGVPPLAGARDVRNATIAPFGRG